MTEEIIRLWKSGLPMAQIADEIDVNISYVRSVLIDAGFTECASHSEGAKRHYAMEADKKWKEIHADLNAGMKLSAIQKKYSMTKERLVDLFVRQKFDYDAFQKQKQAEVDAALKTQLVAFRNAGKTVKEIADALEKSETTIGRYLLKFGLSNKVDRTDIEDNTVLDYWKQGWSMNMISKKLSCSIDTVSKRLSGLGIHIDKSSGIERHFDNIHDKDWDNIRKDLDTCVPVSQIATKYGLRYEAVYRMMERYGYEFTGLTDVDITALTQRISVCQDKDELCYLTAIRDYYTNTGNAPVVYTLSRFMHRKMSIVRNDAIKYNLFGFIGNNNVSVKVLRILKDLDNLNIKYITNDRQVIKSSEGFCLEIDIWLPEYNLGIEVNPTFTHSIDIKPFGKSDRLYHQKKSLAAEVAGVGLLHLYDSDFIDEHAYQVFLTQIRCMVSQKTKLGARKCFVRQITRQESNAFLLQYHFQGGENTSCIGLGLFYQDLLLGVLTIGRPRYAKADYEIIRYCMRPDYIVTGCFQKLFKAFLRTLSSDADILSYMDLNKRMRASSVYENHGFEYLGTTPPDYMWYNQSGSVMRTRYSAMKKNLVAQGFDSSKSEIQIMKEQGFVRVFGAGSKKFMYHYRT